MHRVLVLAALTATVAAPAVAASSAPTAPQRGAHATHAATVHADAAATPSLDEWKDAQSIEVKTEDDLVLQASYFAPRSTKQLAPAALLVHDTGGSRVQLMDLGERLWKTGFAVLVVDLRGHGASASKDLDWSKMDEKAQRNQWALAIRDLEGGARWLASQAEVHKTNLNLVGLRAGAALAARHASRDENVRSVALLSPKREELGIDLAGDLMDLCGLPTYIASRKEGRPEAEAMISEAHEASGGHPYIDLMVSTSKKVTDVKDDRKMHSDLSKWLKDKAFPKRDR